MINWKPIETAPKDNKRPLFIARFVVPIQYTHASHPGAAKKEATMSTVLLTSGTVGTTSTEAAVGDTVTVTLHDENGNGITETGTVEEVLE